MPVSRTPLGFHRVSACVHPSLRTLQAHIAGSPGRRCRARSRSCTAAARGRRAPRVGCASASITSERKRRGRALRLAGTGWVPLGKRGNRTRIVKAKDSVPHHLRCTRSLPGMAEIMTRLQLARGFPPRALPLHSRPRHHAAAAGASGRIARRRRAEKLGGQDGMVPSYG